MNNSSSSSAVSSFYFVSTMTAFEILLLLIVGLSVLVSLILQILDSSQKDEKTYLDDGEQVSDSGSALDFEIDDGKDQKTRKFAKFSKTEEKKVEESGIAAVVDSGDVCSVSGNLENDWEGIERTELEIIFGKAVVFLNSHCNADQIGDVKQQLHGLHRVVLEGPCQESQPNFLNVSARSKWNAWQKLGSISREMAMESYIEILSKAVPEWKMNI